MPDRGLITYRPVPSSPKQGARLVAKMTFPGHQPRPPIDPYHALTKKDKREVKPVFAEL